MVVVWILISYNKTLCELFWLFNLLINIKGHHCSYLFFNLEIQFKYIYIFALCGDIWKFMVRAWNCLRHQNPRMMYSAVQLWDVRLSPKTPPASSQCPDPACPRGSPREWPGPPEGTPGTWWSLSGRSGQRRARATARRAPRKRDEIWRWSK